MGMLLRRSEARECMGVSEYRLKQLIRTGRVRRVYIKDNGYGFYCRNECMLIREEYGDGRK